MAFSEAEYRKVDKKGINLTSNAQRLEQALFDELADKDRKRREVRGTVIAVEKDRVFIDIFDTGVIGVVPVKDYSEQYVRDLRDVVMVNDSLRGIVISHRAKPGEKEKHFIISTRFFVADFWGVAKHFKENDTVIVKCVEVFGDEEVRKQYWWGVSRIIPGIDIMANYSSKCPREKIKVGHYYKCKVKTVDKKARHLKVVPFAECASYT